MGDSLSHLDNLLTVYISWLFRMSAKCVRNLGRTIGRVSTKCEKEYCNSFLLAFITGFSVSVPSSHFSNSLIIH